MAPILDKADRLFILVLPPDFYLHHVEVADPDPADADPASGRL